MAVLTVTNLRPPVEHRANTFLSVLQPATLLTALVNNAAIARGARSIIFDTGTGSAAGYTVIANAVAAGVADNIGTALMLEVVTSLGTELVRVKNITGSASSGTITVAENAIVWADNLVIRIKHFFQIIPVPPAIRSGIFYKDFDRAFSSSFASTPNPVTIIGSHLAGFLSGGSIAFSLNSSSSYAIANGASISSRTWACVHNGGGTTGISFSSTTAANPTLTITLADTYWLSCQTVDSNGRSQTTYRAIFVYDPAGTQPYTDFIIDNLSGDWDSGQWRCNLTLTGDQTLTDIPDGSLAVVWYQNYFDGVEGYVNMWSPFGNNIIYTGYLWSDNDSDNWDNGTGRASFEVISPLQYLDSITDYGTVSLEAKTTPALWSDYASWLTVGRGIHHLLKWDTTILEICDVRNLLGNTYGVKVLEFTEDTLLQRINGVAYQRGVHQKLLCNRIGQLYLSTDSQMLNTANRAALDTVFTITNNDISGGVNVTRNNTDIRAFADMDGFTYSHPTSAPFISMIPGYIESTISYNLPEFRGVGVATDKQQVLNPAGGQTDCNERVGRRLALENVSPKEIRIDMRGCYLGAFDIVPREGWYGWSVNNAALKRELNLSGILTVCRAVSHRFGYEENKFTGVIQTIGVVLQPEAKGPDGIPGNYPTAYPAITTPAPPSSSSGGGGAFTITYGYFGGGHTGLDVTAVTDRLLFSTEATAAHAAGNLSVARSGAVGLSSRSVYGYFIGGQNTAGDAVDTTDRMTLATGTTAAYSTGNLPTANFGLTGLTDASRVYGYMAGSQDIVVTAYRTAFATGITTANSGSNLSTARAYVAAFSDGATYGYFLGGYTDVSGPLETAIADRINLSTGVNAAHTDANLSLARFGCKAFSSTTHGYIMTGGDSALNNPTTIDRTVFSTSVTSSIVATLTTPRRYYATASNDTTIGFVNGGQNNAGSEIATAERMTFSTEVFAAVAGANLSVARGFLDSFNDGAF